MASQRARRESSSPAQRRTSRRAKARHVASRPRPVSSSGHASASPVCTAKTASQCFRSEVTLMARHGSRLFVLAASRTRHASLAKASYPSARIASPRTGSKPLRSWMHASSVVKPAMSANRSPPRGGGSPSVAASMRLARSRVLVAPVAPVAPVVAAGRVGAAPPRSSQATPESAARPTSP